MTNAELAAELNRHKPGFLDLLGGELVAVDPEARTCTFHFKVPLDYCHSGNVVQGGFVAAMLDATVSHAAFAADRTIKSLATLELTTHYTGVTRGEEPLIVTGQVHKMTYKTAFLDGEIINADGEITALVRAVAKLGR
ncbi:MAG: PaaI family thioesterase [Halieaceae bacterium]|jgi:uncharacterized protein (TIGR00369 family)|nr:PaaI family thioesterase [Halieaceae bacterium]